jgi:hypothetical protein
MQMLTKRKRLLLNLLFIGVCGVIFFFLWSAPPETTKPMPNDDKHQRFMTMKKKEAERFCESCHAPAREAPLSPTHPPKYRCLFCHKRL